VLPYDFCPAGWLPTDGSVLLIQNYPALFSAIGTKYGGDGLTTFALPNVDLNFVKLKGCILADPTLSDAAVGEFLGEIELMAFQFCPAGWLPTDGRTLPIRGNEAVFSLLVVRYGGDGRTTFGLPNLDCLAVMLHRQWCLRRLSQPAAMTRRWSGWSRDRCRRCSIALPLRATERG